MNKIDPDGIVAKFRKAESFLVCAHTGPDGDAIGSMLATYHLLRALGKERVVCACADPVPEVYKWLPGADLVVQHVPTDPPFELAVLVDVSRPDRLGCVADLIGPDTAIIVIDHHLDDEPGGHYNYIDARHAAVGEIIMLLFEVAGIPLTSEAAVCIYVALATDTGGFRFDNTTPYVHLIAAKLLETGIDVPEVSTRIFEGMSYVKVQLLGRLLRRLRILADGALAYSHITVKDLEQTGGTEEDLDGLINFARNIHGVRVAILFREIDPATTKLSLRSHVSFNSAEFLKQFGGGGHAAAAGATMSVPLKEAQATVLSQVRQILRETP